jgi:hypothetical protein
VARPEVHRLALDGGSRSTPCDQSLSPNDDRDGLFGPTTVRWYPMVQHFDGAGFADLLRTLSPYRRLDSSVREPLLDAIAERIRNKLDDHATRRYLSVLRIGQRID